MSHPAILGCGERNQAYRSARDLHRLTVDAHYHRRRWLTGAPFVLDQINHDRFVAWPGLLTHPGVRCVFIVRAPHPSVASMVQVLGPHYGTTAKDAVTHYVDRMASIAGYARQIDDPDRAFALDYHDLTERSSTALEHLRVFLGLAAPLSERYTVFDFTGTRGDPSPIIRTGRIVRDRPARTLDLGPDMLANPTSAYTACRAALRAHCATVPDGLTS